TNQPDVIEFMILPSGVVVVNGGITEVDAGASGIWVLRPNASTKQCELVGQIGSGAGTFAPSPDGSRIAFSMVDTDAGINALWSAPLDGGPPVEVRSNDAGVGAGISGFGPRWVQGGASLAFSAGITVIDGGSSDNAVVVPVTGGSVTPVVFSASSQDEFLVPTSGWTCSIGAVGSATPAAGIFLSFGLFLARRRKKKEKRGDS
ncbi:MAG: hypothetical protein ACREJX_06680, partial [Polyangiaceae bacterium]